MLNTNMKKILLITFISVTVFCSLFLGLYYGIKAFRPKYTAYLFNINNVACVDDFQGDTYYELFIGYKCGFLTWARYPEYIDKNSPITYNSTLSIIINSYKPDINDLSSSLNLYVKFESIQYQSIILFQITSIYNFETSYTKLLHFANLGGDLLLNFSISLI